MGMNGNSMPMARFNDLVINDVDEGLLIYDEFSHTIHHLNAVSRDVWRASTGEATAADIARDTNLSVDLVRVALAELNACDLLAEKRAPTDLPALRSRRSFVRQAAVASAIPAIVSVSAPIAARASSPGSTTMTCGLVVPGCSNFAVCCTSHCRGNGWEIASASLLACQDNGGGSYTATLMCTCRLP